MKITNNLKLPQAIVNACSTERHTPKGTYSATTLLKGTREILLTSRHFDEIEQDVADMIWAIWGTAVHALLEEQDTKGVKEERLEIDVLGRKVSGQIDHQDLESLVITDYKTASTWKVIFNDFDDWDKQALIYAYLILMAKDVKITRARFIALLKDHSKTDAKRRADYPQSPVHVHELEITDEKLEEIEQFIFSKITELKENEEVADDDLPLCTAEERWASEDKWAIMKEGRKSAVKLHDTEESAVQHLIDLDSKHYIEYRQGASRKCPDYCPAKDFCSQWAEEQARLEGQDD